MDNVSLQVGTILKGSTDYRIEEQLHQGGFGITYRASGTYMAGNIPQIGTFTIKEFFIGKICSRDASGNVTVSAEHKESYNKAKLDFKQEAEILHNLHHDNIVPVNEVFEQNNTVYYVMSFLGNTSLYRYVASRGGKLSESESKEIIVSVSKAVKHLHDNQILHLDIKPDNIMMQQMGGQYRPILIDFGQALYFANGKPKNPKAIGGYSKGYSPLELKNEINTFQTSIDVYSLAATLLYMLSGVDPCDASEQGRSKLYQVLPDSVSNKCAETLVRALACNASGRIQNVDSFISELRQVATSPIGGNIPTGSGNATEAIIPSSKPSFPTKYLYIIIGVVCLVAIILVGVKFMSSNSDADSASERLKPDSTVVIEDGQTSPTTTEEQVEIKDENTSTQSTKESEPEIKSKPEQETKQATSSASEKTSGTVNLGYGTWTGGLKNGKPNGNGTIHFTRSHSIGSSSAESGDYADCYFLNGEFNSGKLHRSNGEVETILP